MASNDDGESPAPIDRPILEFIESRLASTPQIDESAVTDENGHLELRATVDSSYYPDVVEEALLVVRWYRNDDFQIHYTESHDDGRWECRWDRHPNPHNTREHYHPPPDAPTPGEDADWPADYRDVISTVFGDIEERIESLWEV